MFSLIISHEKIFSQGLKLIQKCVLFPGENYHEILFHNYKFADFILPCLNQTDNPQITLVTLIFLAETLESLSQIDFKR